MSSSPSRRRPSLGRGLDALFADDSDLAPVPVSGPVSGQASGDETSPDNEQTPSSGPAGAGWRRGTTTLPVSSLTPNPFQPRTHFDQDELNGLADSIRQQGVLSPVIVREDPAEEGRYQIVAGERRWRAAQLAQLHDIPVIIRSLDDADTAQIALLENIQRQDLDAVEEGAGYRCLIDQFGYTQEGLGRMLGKSRSHIANTLRLLDLPEAVLAHLKSRELSAGHARALLSHPDPVAGARIVIDDGLTVRQTEAMVRRALAPDAAPPGGAEAGPTGDQNEMTPPGADDNSGLSPEPSHGPIGPMSAARPEKDADTIALENDLTACLGLRVAVDQSGKGDAGRMVIQYTSLDQLDELIRRLKA